ncbi:MAG TPA: hypothetical protein VI408_16830 [Gaiellaceae bacterium]
MQMAKEAGLHADVLSSVWHRGADPADDLPPLRRAVDAATAEGVDPILAVWQLSGDTPTTAAERAAFAAYTVALLKALPDVHTVIVDNEPNLNLFWLPQYDAAGGDAAAVAYVRLLAATYDAVKAAEPGTTVIGGALSPHGSDDPGAKRQTHSPTRFLEDMGAAYRASGRTAPLMDELSVHVYGESSRVPPTLEHPNSTSIGIADYAKLVRLVDDAFGGRLPIVYGEYGVETAIPPVHAGAYTGHEVVEPVDEATQARYYRQAIELAACQPRVRMLLFFHVLDEVPLAGLQSGLYYADGAPKESARVVRDTPVTCRR